MKTLEQAFTERQSLIETIESSARSILSEYCKRRNFLLAGRSKTIDSLRDKLETGRYANLLSIDDAIAFSIVIDTLDQEIDVQDYLKKTFNVQSIKSGTTLQDERVFDFDSTRVYCRIQDNLGLIAGSDAIIIEIQIRTILQHAWSKITHPQVYKANTFDARAGRFAAEIMAQLESIDRSFASFRSASRSVKNINRRDMTASSAITAMIDQLIVDGVIPSELRPSNGRRLGENIFASIKYDARRNYNKPIDVIKTMMLSQKDKFPRSVSIYQLSITALHDAGILEHGLPNRPRKYYVTDELISLFPSAASIPNRIAIV